MSALFEIFKLIFFCLVVPILLLAYLVFYALLSLAVMAIIISVITGKVDLAFQELWSIHHVVSYSVSVFGLRRNKNNGFYSR